MLHKLQTSFMKGIYGIDSEDNALSFICETKEKSAVQQLSIYRSSIFGGLKKALAQTYPVTKELVGEDFFNLMLGQFIKETPCKFQDLNDYGSELASFIEVLKQARSVPYLADIARLEWFYNIALNAQVQSNNLHELSQLTAVQQTSLKLALPTGSALFQSPYPIDQIWGMQWDELDIDDKGCDTFLIIWKNLSEVRIDTLNEEAFYFLSQINSGKCFVDVCQATLNKFGAININSLFDNAVKNGWVQSYSSG